MVISLHCTTINSGSVLLQAPTRPDWALGPKRRTPKGFRGIPQSDARGVGCIGVQKVCEKLAGSQERSWHRLLNGIAGQLPPVSIMAGRKHLAETDARFRRTKILSVKRYGLKAGGAIERESGTLHAQSASFVFESGDETSP